MVLTNRRSVYKGPAILKIYPKRLQKKVVLQADSTYTVLCIVGLNNRFSCIVLEINKH